MFRWGIVGSGFAARKFVLGLRKSEDGLATLVYSRTLKHAQQFARDFRVAEAVSDFEAAVRSGKVDAFYIATPPTLHRLQAVACLAAGKPVLIEKPFAASRADAEAIVEAALANEVFCMEGVWTRFLPLSARLRALVKEGAIGTPRSLCGSFGSSNTPDESDNQFQAALAGGALLHRGIYAMAAAFDLLGPAALAASAGTLGPTGVDEDCSVILRHDGGALTTLRASLRAPLSNDLTIEGTHGLLKVFAPIYRPFRMQTIRVRPAGRGQRGNRFVESIREGDLAQGLQQRLGGRIRFPGRGSRTFVVRYRGNGYHYEADEVARCVRRGDKQSALMPLGQSVMMADLMERARNSWRSQPWTTP